MGETFQVHTYAAGKLRRTRRRTTKPVQSRRVADPEVWQIALKLADGDAHRLRVIDYTTVIVENNPRP